MFVNMLMILSKSAEISYKVLWMINVLTIVS